MFSMVTVASSTRMPTASARPPRVMMLMVSPSADRQQIEARIDSGIEIVMISVLRQLPRNSRINKPGQRAGDHRFAYHAGDGGAHEHRLIARAPRSCRSGGRRARICGSFSLMLLMMSMVEALPVFNTVINTARRPSKRTMLVCGE